MRKPYGRSTRVAEARSSGGRLGKVGGFMRFTTEAWRW